MDFATYKLNPQGLRLYKIADYSGTTTNSKNKDHQNPVAHGSPEAHSTREYMFSYVTYPDWRVKQ